MRCDFHGEKAGAPGAFCRCLMAEINDVALGATNHEKQAGIGNRNLAAMLFSQTLQRVAVKPAHISEVAVRSRHTFHQSGADISEPQRFVGGPDPCNAPGCHLTDAIACDGDRLRQHVGNACMGCQRRCHGQDLADMVGRQFLGVSRDQVARIMAEISRCRAKDRLCRGLPGRQIECPGRKGSLATTEQREHSRLQPIDEHGDGEQIRGTTGTEIAGHERLMNLGRSRAPAETSDSARCKERGRA